MINFSGKPLALVEPWSDGLDFAAVGGGLLLVVLFAFIWAGFLRKKGRRRRKHRHHPHYKKPAANPTLAQTGGLPPVRDKDQSSGQPH